jgi:hypothetical protein
VCERGREGRAPRLGRENDPAELKNPARDSRYAQEVPRPRERLERWKKKTGDDRTFWQGRDVRGIIAPCRPKRGRLQRRDEVWTAT